MENECVKQFFSQGSASDGTRLVIHCICSQSSWHLTVSACFCTTSYNIKVHEN